MRQILVMGAGLIGSRHIEAVQAHAECALAGVLDPDPTCQTGDNVRRFYQIDDVDVAVDGVIIATPTHLHHLHGEEAARCGWHMLIEKPVAASTQAAQNLARALEKYGVRCLVGHHRRYHASISALRSAISSGMIGDPVTSTMIWSVRKPDTYFDTNWRRTGGSPVMINLIHDVDLLRFVLGEVEDVTGFAAQNQRQAGRIESGAVVLRFGSGAVGSISFSDTAPSPWGFEAGTAENPNIATSGEDMWWISGTKGGISFPSLTLWGGAEDWSQALTGASIKAPKTIPLDAQLDHFLQVIRGLVPPLISLEDANSSLRVTQTIEEKLTQTLTL